jgi:hypothetical protein
MERAVLRDRTRRKRKEIPMRKQSAYPLSEPELAPVLPSPTGTSHTLKVEVDLTTKTVTISDSSLHIKDGDEVVWDFKAKGGGKLNLGSSTLKIVFGNSNLLSKPGKPDSDPKITVEISEDTTGPLGPYTATYSIYLDTTILKTSHHRTDSTSPQLVIDNMGKPPGARKGDPGCGDEGEKGERYRSWPRRHTA